MDVTSLPQDPYQRQSAWSTHIRDRTHGMVGEASTCETIGTVMGNGGRSYHRSTQGQAVHERKRPTYGHQSRTPKTPPTTATRKTRDRCNNRLRQINPNSFIPIRSSLSRDKTYLGAPSRSQTFIHPRAETASKLYRGIGQRRRVRMGTERRACQRRQGAGATQRPHGDRRQR